MTTFSGLARKMLSGALTTLDLFARLVPTVPKPEFPQTVQRRLLWTFLAVLVYMVASQVPLLGIRDTVAADPLFWMRTIFASQRGTLMELGIGPILTGSLVMQLLSSAGVFSFDKTKENEVTVFRRVSRFIGILMAVAQ
ncbi:SecY/SEC61-alpha family protein, partial [Kipferlia bialata]|eukprot:g9393.t1